MENVKKETFLLYFGVKNMIFKKRAETKISYFGQIYTPGLCLTGNPVIFLVLKSGGAGKPYATTRGILLPNSSVVFEKMEGSLIRYGDPLIVFSLRKQVEKILRWP